MITGEVFYARPTLLQITLVERLCLFMFVKIIYRTSMFSSSESDSLSSFGG